MFYYYELKWFNDPIHVSEDLSFTEPVVVFLKPLKVVKISVGILYLCTLQVLTRMSKQRKKSNKYEQTDETKCVFFSFVSGVWR